jgi:enoyl-CoA hydratase
LEHRTLGRLRGGRHEHQQSQRSERPFFTDLHDAFDRLERDFNPHPVVLTGQGDVFSAGIDFQYSFDIFGSGDLDYRNYRATNLRIFQYPRPTVAAINGHAIAGGLITALDCDFRVAARKSASSA